MSIFISLSQTSQDINLYLLDRNQLTFGKESHLSYRISKFE